MGVGCCLAENKGIFAGFLEFQLNWVDMEERERGKEIQSVAGRG